MLHMKNYITVFWVYFSSNDPVVGSKKLAAALSEGRVYRVKAYQCKIIECTVTIKRDRSHVPVP